MASTLGEPQAQVDQFDLVYNTECPHQGPPGHVTPTAGLGRDARGRSAEAAPLAAPSPSPVAAAGALLPENTRRVTVNGGIKIKGVTFQIGSHLTGTLITIIRDEARSRPDYTKPREDRPRP